MLHGFRTGLWATAAKFPGMRVLTRLCTGGRLVVPVRVLGHTMYVNAFDPGISWQLLQRGMREDAHVAQIRGALRPGMRGIEMGANIGFFTVVEAPIIGSTGFIWCIEPVPDNTTLLRRTIAVNGFGNRTSVHQLLVGDRDGSATMHLSVASNSHSISSQQASAVSVELPMMRLDSFMEKNSIDPKTVDFIRMDIEGYEVAALAGMERLLREAPDLKFFIELHPQAYAEWGWTLRKFLERLRDFGLHVRQAAKERERNAAGQPVTLILNSPGIDELCHAVEHKWTPGGVQAYFDKS
jgi:FkbM family methyltransferase